MQQHPELKKLLVPKLTKYIPHEPHVKQAAFLLLSNREALFGGAAGGGKILSNDGVVLTPFGWRRGIDLKVGDLINNPDGTVQRIIQIKPEVELEKWVVRFSDGTETDVAADHLWLAWRNSKGRKVNNKRIHGGQSAEVIETRELLDWMDRGYAPQIPICKPQPFNRTTKEADRLDAYLLGVLLGDGCITNTNGTAISIACDEKDKPHYKKQFGIENINWESKGTIRFLGDKQKYIKEKLSLYKLLGTRSGTKFIPEIYKYGSIEIRQAIIQGLMDTDGYSAKEKNACYYDSVSEQLANDVTFILRSLGCVVTITKGEGSYKDRDGNKKICQDVYSLYIKAPNPDSLFRMKRKQHGKFGKNLIQKSVVEIRIGGTIKGRCISVSNPNGLYITNDFIVTHNSDALLMAALQYVDYPNYSALILRKTFADLSLPNAIMDRAKSWLMGTDAKWHEQLKTWVFPSGARITFGYMDSQDAHYRYQSAEFQFIGIDEATQIPMYQILYMLSRLRRLAGWNVPLRFRLASNPGGPSHLDIKKRYIDPETAYAEDGTKNIFIKSTLDDNPSLDRESYIRNLKELPAIERERLLNGDWSIQDGGRVFKRDMFQVIDEMPPEATIRRRVRFWDCASTEPSKQNKDPDWTAGVLLAQTVDGKYIIEDVVHVRKTPGQIHNMILGTAMQDGYAVEIGEEQEMGSAGKAVTDTRARALAGFAYTPIRPSGSKYERAKPMATQAEHGNIYMMARSWNRTLLDELEVFPDGTHDDMVDALAGAFNRLTQNSEARISFI